MKDIVIKIDTAMLAKNKGFPQQSADYIHTNVLYKDGIKRGYYYNIESDNRVCVIPTQSLLQKWLREEHGIYIQVIMSHSFLLARYVKDSLRAEVETLDCTDNIEFKTYEEALEKGLQEALKLIVLK